MNLYPTRCNFTKNSFAFQEMILFAFTNNRFAGIFRQILLIFRTFKT